MADLTAANGTRPEHSAQLTTALAQLRGVQLDEAALRAHVMRPAGVSAASSDQGRHDLPATAGQPLVRVAEQAPEFRLGWRFNPAGFVKSVENALSATVAGYALGLNENGTRIETLIWNWAHEPQDTGEGWATGVRQHVASLSKQMTAIAMTRLLAAHGIAATTPIIDYLPAYWTKGQNVSQITFANLMTHTSGLDYGVSSSASDFQFMKGQIAAGTTHLGQYWYQNMNFGLCRILLATINGNIPVGFSIPDLFGITAFNDVVWDAVTITAYEAYLAANVFGPSSVTDPSLAHETDDALAYTFPVSGNGWNSGDLTTMAGGAAWHMSVDDILKVMGTFRRSGTIVSAAQAQTMLDDGFGIDWIESTNLGNYYAKNGLWEDGGGHVEQGVLFYLPGNMELAVLVNSPVGTPAQFLYSVVAGAYTSNIVPVLQPLGPLPVAAPLSGTPAAASEQIRA